MSNNLDPVGRMIHTLRNDEIDLTFCGQLAPYGIGDGTPEARLVAGFVFDDEPAGLYNRACPDCTAAYARHCAELDARRAAGVAADNARWGWQA